MRERFTQVLSISLLVGACTSSVWPQCEVAHLTAPNGKADEGFGGDVSIWGDVALIGSRWFGNNLGVAYFYRYDGAEWVFEQQLSADPGFADDLFGFSIGLKGERAIVSVFGRGFAYIYQDDEAQWVIDGELGPSDEFGEGFGFSVDIDGDIAVIGAVWDDEIATDAGAVYVFRYDGLKQIWEEEAKLFASDAAEGHWFGYDVAIDNPVIVIGSKDYFDEEGAVYVFRWSEAGWEEEQRLVSPNQYNDGIGFAVDIDGDRIIAGISNDADNGAHAGAALIYNYDGATWLMEKKLLASDGMTDDSFGFPVAIEGDGIVVGATGVENDAGAAYLFEYDGVNWVEQSKLVGSDNSSDDHFGVAVALGDPFVLVGAEFDEPFGFASGSAYMFEFGEPDCNGNGILDACDLLEGTSADCNENLIPDECDIDNGLEEDCNENGIPDSCEVANGEVDDCDGDEIPDECQTLYFVATSPPMGPLGNGFPQTFVISAPPESGTTAVMISLTARGDLDALAEFVDVFLNDEFLGTVFQDDGSSCPDAPDQAQLTLDAELFNSLVDGGDAEFVLVASFAVDPDLCEDSFITIQVEYQAVTEDDCNGNGVPDICDIINGDLIDDNGNWIPDECECLADLDNDGSVGVKDLLSLLGVWGPCKGCPADFDDSGDVGVKDLLVLLGNWGPCP